jgi:hypothetical protein
MPTNLARVPAPVSVPSTGDEVSPLSSQLGRSVRPISNMPLVWAPFQQCPPSLRLRGGDGLFISPSENNQKGRVLGGRRFRRLSVQPSSVIAFIAQRAVFCAGRFNIRLDGCALCALVIVMVDPEARSCPLGRALAGKPPELAKCSLAGVSSFTGG